MRSWCTPGLSSHSLIFVPQQDVKDATRKESPDGHVLYIEELRKYLGVSLRTGIGDSSPSTDDPEALPEVVLTDHGMHDDSQKMDKEDINPHKFFRYLGCIDTQMIMKDTGSGMGESLSSLTSQYSLYKVELKRPEYFRVLAMMSSPL